MVLVVLDMIVLRLCLMVMLMVVMIMLQCLADYATPRPPQASF